VIPTYKSWIHLTRVPPIQPAPEQKIIEEIDLQLNPNIQFLSMTSIPEGDRWTLQWILRFLSDIRSYPLVQIKLEIDIHRDWESVGWSWWREVDQLMAHFELLKSLDIYVRRLLYGPGYTGRDHIENCKDLVPKFSLLAGRGVRVQVDTDH
jgi:hypothetical protein